MSKAVPALALRAVGGMVARKVMGGKDDEEGSGVMDKVKGAAKIGCRLRTSTTSQPTTHGRARPANGRQSQNWLANRYG